MTEPREIELKLELDPASAERFERSSRATLGAPSEEPRRLEATYYDNRKHGLRRRGLSLRVRRDGQRRVQTLKAIGPSGLLDRAEWEADANQDAPDPGLFDDRHPRNALRARGALAPLFETAVARTTWLVREGASTIEVALDRGSVRADARTEPLIELELELKEGSARDLFDLARRIATADGVRIGVRSKSDRGYALLDGTGVAKAEPLALDRAMTAGDAFAAIARSCLKQFRLNEPGLIARRDPDSLHQARVGVRRLRSALSIFGEVVRDAELDGLKAELKTLSGKLGEARDLDVYLAGPVASGGGPDAEAGAPGYADRVAAERERAYDDVVAHLDSRAFRVFTVDLARWIETGPWRFAREGAALRDGPVRDFAETVLRRRNKSVRKSGRHLHALDPDARHRVRIRAKKLRYASEFFASLLEGKRARHRQSRFTASLEALQDNLGVLNDVRIERDVAERLAAGAPQPDASVPFAAGSLTGGGEAEAPRLLKAAMAAHRRFRRTKPF